jgi:hypothetical protein
VPLTWSEERQPTAECSYTHVVSETPLGRLGIEWKGWKERDCPTCMLPWDDGFIVATDLLDAKIKVQNAWDAKAVEMAKLASTYGQSRSE